MNRPSDSQRPAARAPPKKSLRTQYLTLYNLASAALWLRVFWRVVLTVAVGGGWEKVFAGTDETVRLTQSVAVLEVVHAALGEFNASMSSQRVVSSITSKLTILSPGIVRAPLLTTLMQVASRFLLVWGIAFNFPSTTAASPAYTTMLLAWSATEIIRYGYFAYNLHFGGVPGWLTWLRYNTFFVLYPLGISSECWLVYSATGPAREQWGQMWEWALYAVLAIYVPGAYVLYTHMMGQRRKVLRGLREKKAT
jgi:very-long-chain (3R)-3-hydroxyacyl-CoA dehydratase